MFLQHFITDCNPLEVVNSNTENWSNKNFSKNFIKLKKRSDEDQINQDAYESTMANEEAQVTEDGSLSVTETGIIDEAANDSEKSIGEANNQESDTTTTEEPPSISSSSPSNEQDQLSSVTQSEDTPDKDTKGGSMIDAENEIEASRNGGSKGGGG